MFRYRFIPALAIAILATLTLQTALAYTPDIITPSEPALATTYSPTTNGVQTGNQVAIATTLHNKNQMTESFAAIIEVRDANGITEQLGWQTGSLGSDNIAQMSISWIPQKAGKYELRVFVISSIENPMVLSAVVTATVEIEAGR